MKNDNLKCKIVNYLSLIRLRSYLKSGVILFFFLFSSPFFFLDFSFAATSSDAIAIRVVSNPDHYSPIRWYAEKGFTGSPQSLIVDGFEAVRDGRTVYVNAANPVDTDGDGVLDRLYTNIYLISYTQDSESATVDIFGQILSHWKLATNITVDGSCSNDASIACTYDAECGGNDFCTSQKAKVIRDLRRLSDLTDVETALKKYKDKNGYYPKLSSGSYLPNTTISTWPSWQETLGQDMGAVLPVDPVNKLGVCSGGDSMSRIGSDHVATDASCYAAGPSYTRSCSPAFWDYSFTLDKSGNYKTFVETSNNGSSPYGELHTLNSSFGPESVCPADGVQHKVEVYIDGLSKGHMCNDAVAPTSVHQFGYVDLGFLTAGTHVIKYRWVNDWTYNPDGIWGSPDDADSNIRIYQVGLIGEGDYNSATCWNESTRKFADPILNSRIDLPVGSNAYIYSASPDGRSFKLDMGFETGSISGDIFNYTGGSGDFASIGDELANGSPVISCGTLAGSPHAGFKGHISAIDPDGDGLKNWSIAPVAPDTWSSWTGWVWSSGIGLFPKSTSLSNQKEISAAAAGNEGEYGIRITVSDSNDSVTEKECRIRINDDIPVIAANSATYPASSTKDMVYSLTARQFNAINYPLSHALLSGSWPLLGLVTSFVEKDGVYTYLVNGKLNPVYTLDNTNNILNFIFQVQDSHGLSNTADFNINITNNPPRINKISCPASVRINNPYSCAISASDPEGNVIEAYSFSGLPAGLTGYAGTGMISGTPTGIGTYGISVSARDEFGYAGLSTVHSLRVNNYCGDGNTQKPNGEGVAEECDGNIDAACTVFNVRTYNGLRNCGNNCLWNACRQVDRCGDGALNGTPAEPCDGVAGTASSPAESSATKQYSCSGTCSPGGGWCGDGICDSARGEFCGTCASDCCVTSCVFNSSLFNCTINN